MSNADGRQSWYQATIRWAVMVEGRGIREWKEGTYLYRSEDRQSAFRRALAIGERGQRGLQEGTRRPRWVETRLAEVARLDCLGHELAEDTELRWTTKPARQRIPYEYRFEPASKEPQSSF